MKRFFIFQIYYILIFGQSDFDKKAKVFEAGYINMLTQMYSIQANFGGHIFFESLWQIRWSIQ